MDPISQGVLGGIAAQNRASALKLAAASFCGVVAGLAPDLDALIRSDSDPLLYLEYHRQFTHALIFIPFGALFVACVIHPIVRRTLGFRETWVFCVLGYATHGLLDACTSYGTQLFWPFSNERVAWHTISIIDPIFTVPLLLCLVLAIVRNRVWWARLGLIWIALILTIGWIQHERAYAAGYALAASRGHEALRLHAKPSFGNMVVWKSIYEYDGRYYVDAVRVSRTVTYYPGDSILKLEIARDLPWLEEASQQAEDLRRFRWFSNDFLAMDPARANFVVDMRYSMLPDEIEALWGIQMSPKAVADAHVDFIWDRKVTAAKRQRLLDLILGRGASSDQSDSRTSIQSKAF